MIKGLFTYIKCRIYTYFYQPQYCHKLTMRHNRF
jgi:hypothetical protein